MGAWGTGSFENDDASDWLSDFIESRSNQQLEVTLSKITSNGEAYLEAPDCCNAIAAAEVVAAMKGKPNPAMPDEAKAAIKSDAAAGSRLAPLALKAVARIKTESELQDLWSESEDSDGWQQSVAELESRLR